MKLNPPQRQAVEHVHGPLLILAGAGTGKTRVITERAANLVTRHGVELSQLLCVTFTNKAAREMRERIEQRLDLVEDADEFAPPDIRRRRRKKTKAGEMTVCTFHALGALILRRHPDRVGLRKGFSIYTQSDQLALVRTAMREQGVTGSKPEAVHFRISRAKNAGTRPTKDDPEGEIAAAIFDDYHRMLRHCNAADFDDLQVLTLQLLESFPDIRDQYREQWRFIQVDEYQDTNAIQLRLLKQLVGPERNICVVGDDDQSIYAWRGAEVRNILQFDRHFGGDQLQVVRLEDNYRSTGFILDAANAVIRYNPVRTDKTLRSSRGRGAPVRVIAAADETEEVRAILNHVERESNRGARLNECAILFRTAAQTRPFEEMLRERQMPYTLIGGQRYFERKEVRDTVAYLSLLVNDRDDAALIRVVNYPSRGIGASTLEGLAELAKERRCSMAKAMRGATVDDLRDAGAPDSGARALVEFADRMAQFRWRAEQGANAADVAEELITAARLKLAIEHDYRKDASEVHRRKQNVQGVIDSLRAFLVRRDVFPDGRAPTLSDYLERVALVDDQDDADKAKRLGKEALILITIHSCKGLEFPHVFIAGCEDGILPHKRSAGERDDGLDEERRLAYVAMTRAMDTLTLTYAQSRKQYGRDTKPTPSRFLQEIPQECFESEKAEVDRQARFRNFLGKMKAAIAEDPPERSGP